MRLEAEGRLPPARYILAEDLNAFFPAGNYRDILTMECDLAQISELILLFSESYGSAAELGAFAMSKDIAKRLAVLIDDENYGDNSFVKLGPLRILTEVYSDSAVCVLDRNQLGIHNIRDLSRINKEIFLTIVTECINERRKTIENRSSFSSVINGHILKLSVGIIQIYGALELYELHCILLYFGIEIEEEDLTNLLNCAEFVKWLKIEVIGVRKFYVANIEKKAANIPFVKGSGIKKNEFELLARDYWKRYDALRFSQIAQAASRFSIDV